MPLKPNELEVLNRAVEGTCFMQEAVEPSVVEIVEGLSEEMDKHMANLGVQVSASDTPTEREDTPISDLPTLVAELDVPATQPDGEGDAAKTVVEVPDMEGAGVKGVKMQVFDGAVAPATVPPPPQDLDPAPPAPPATDVLPQDPAPQVAPATLAPSPKSALPVASATVVPSPEPQAPPATEVPPQDPAPQVAPATVAPSPKSAVPVAPATAVPSEVLPQDPAPQVAPATLAPSPKSALPVAPATVVPSPQPLAPPATEAPPQDLVPQVAPATVAPSPKSAVPVAPATVLPAPVQLPPAAAAPQTLVGTAPKAAGLPPNVEAFAEAQALVSGQELPADFLQNLAQCLKQPEPKAPEADSAARPNSNTHRASYARLTRLMDGKNAVEFPHMARMWGDKSQRANLFKMWVEKAENRSAVEGEVLQQRTMSTAYEGVREFLSIRDMIGRGWPVSKINGVIAGGGGVADEHAPQDPSLVSFWVTTKRKQTELDESKTQATARTSATVNPASMGSLFNASMPMGSGLAPGAMLEGQAMDEDALTKLQRSLSGVFPFFFLVSFLCRPAGGEGLSKA